MHDEYIHFWPWALQRYRREGVPDALLELQDTYRLNIGILLWCCWCAEFYEPVSGSFMKKATESVSRWNRLVTCRIREIRILSGTDTEFAAGKPHMFERAIRAAEILAEKNEYARLATLAESGLERSGEKKTGDRIFLLAGQNLSTFCRNTGVTRNAPLQKLLDRTANAVSAGAVNAQTGP